MPAFLLASVPAGVPVSVRVSPLTPLTVPLEPKIFAAASVCPS